MNFIAKPDTNSCRQNSYLDAWAEIVPNGRICPHTGLKHAKLYSLLSKGGAARPFVRVANLRDPGARQGKTLFHLGDMLRFLDALAEQQGAGLLRDSLLPPSANEHAGSQNPEPRS